jgi:hypothetical protein
MQSEDQRDNAAAVANALKDPETKEFMKKMGDSSRERRGKCNYLSPIFDL